MANTSVMEVFAAKFPENHFTLSYTRQQNNEKAHVGGMDMEQLAMIVNLTNEMENIHKTLGM